MYYDEYWTKLTKRHKEYKMIQNNETIKSVVKDNQILYAKFQGLIVTGKIFKKDNIDTKSKYITFVTIASNDTIYHDLIIHGYHKISKLKAIQGYGKVIADKYAPYVQVISWKPHFISRNDENNVL